MDSVLVSKAESRFRQERSNLPLFSALTLNTLSVQVLPLLCLSKGEEHLLKAPSSTNLAPYELSHQT